MCNIEYIINPIVGWFSYKRATLSPNHSEKINKICIHVGESESHATEMRFRRQDHKYFRTFLYHWIQTVF